MKIIYLINSLKNGGPVNMLYTLIKYIDSNMNDIMVIALKSASQDNARDFSALRCRVCILDEPNLKRGIKKVQKIINEEKPDVVHSHGGVADIINSKLEGEHKTLSTVHCDPDEEFTMKKGRIIGWFKATVFIHTLREISNPIGCSKTVANKIMKKRHLPIRYIRNGIDLEKVNNVELSVTRTSLNIPENNIVITFCGYLSKRKNAEFLCDAIMKSKRKDIKLLILGDGEEFPTIKRKVAADKRIIMAGRVSCAYDFLKISDYFISASLSEGLPLAVMEGMACGLPVILSDIESHREIKECCTEGVKLFSIDDDSVLLNIISQLSIEESQTCGKYAKQTVLCYLNAKRMADEYISEYINC